MDLWVHSLEVTTWVCEVRGHEGAAAVQRRAEARHIPLAPCEAHNANKNCSICQQERQTLQLAMGKIPQGEGPTHSWQVDYIGPMPVAPGGYKWILTAIDTYSGLGFAYLMVDANVQNIGLEQKMPLSI